MQSLLHEITTKIIILTMLIFFVVTALSYRNDKEVDGHLTIGYPFTFYTEPGEFECAISDCQTQYHIPNLGINLFIIFAGILFLKIVIKNNKT